jgi:YD repeat-containing protein
MLSDNKLSLFIFVFLLSNLSFAIAQQRDTTVKTDWTKEELKGKISSIVHYNYTGGIIKKVKYNPKGFQTSVWEPCGNANQLCVLDSSVYDAAGIHVMRRDFGSFTTTYKYDNLGNMIEMDRRPKSSINRSVLMTFAFAGRDCIKITEVNYQLDGLTIMSCYVSDYKYNDRHQLIEHISTPISKMTGQKISYRCQYDDRGNVIYSGQFWEKGEKSVEYFSKYDGQNNRIEHISSSPTGGEYVNNKESFHYDHKGRQVEYSQILRDGKVFRRSEFKFDDTKRQVYGFHYKGNELKQESVQLLDNEGLLLEEKVSESGKLLRKKVFIRDIKKNVISQVRTDAEGKIIFKREFKISYYQ